MKAIASLTVAVVMLLTTLPSPNALAASLSGHTPSQHAAWIVYWDARAGLTEAVLHKERFDSLIYFGAFFNNDDSLFYPPELIELEDVLKIILADSPKPTYLSFVNDFTLPDGTYSNKSVPLLRRLLQTSPERSQRLADDLVALTASRGLQGIEIDFESILSDLPLWDSFFTFLRDLYTKCSAKGLRLRVLLEPRTPFDSLIFPVGPEYVMMCYNLYGYHSGPGPKANRDFLTSMAGKMSVIPKENRSFALALGGFDWANGKVSQLTAQEAERILAEQGATMRRYEEVASFAYTDAKGILHEIWYADDTTVAYWIGVLNGLGEDSVDLWKLGESIPE
ncbi:MAG: hypothetical protein AB9880_06815 [Christensenellales bacterium]